MNIHLNGPYVLRIFVTHQDAQAPFETLVQHARSQQYPLHLPADAVVLPPHHQQFVQGTSVNTVMELHGTLARLSQFVEKNRDLILGHGFLEICPLQTHQA